jgi:hypothetical protein
MDVLLWSRLLKGVVFDLQALVRRLAGPFLLITLFLLLLAPVVLVSAPFIPSSFWHFAGSRFISTRKIKAE